MQRLAALALALAGATVSAQDPDAALAAFRKLPADKQSAAIATLERRILLDPDPLLQSIVSWSRAHQSYPVAEPPRFHDPAKWAKGVAPERTVARAGTPAHDAVAAKIVRPPFLPDLHKAVWYDWGTGRVVRAEQPLRDDQVFENLLHGYPPGSDAAVAHLLEIYDRGFKPVSEHRVMAAYLEHLYADLNAVVYEGITLYDAWYSGEVVDVPDVDAIPFARQILKTRSYRSPIPKGRRRTQLYQKIRDRTFEYRVYRTLREAAAAAFVRAKPVLDKTYQPLVARFHFLYASADFDPQPTAELLRKYAKRSDFFRETDRAMNDNPDAFELREYHRKSLVELAAKMRALALDALARQQ